MGCRDRSTPECAGARSCYMHNRGMGVGKGGEGVAEASKGVMKVAAETTSGCRRLLTQLGCSGREGGQLPDTRA